MKTTALIDNDELMAFVDGVLDVKSREQFEERLRDDAALAATVAVLRAQRKVLHGALDPVLNEPIPQRLLLAAAPSKVSRQRVAAAVVWLAVGLGVGSLASWQYLTPPDVTTSRVANGGGVTDLPRFVHQATMAHAVYAPEVRHPVEVRSGDSQALDGWLSKRLGRKMQAPDLSGQGFALVGGRLLPAEVGKPAAQFMYEDRQGQRLTVYLRGMAQPTPETAFRFAEQGGVSTFYWVERDWGYALSGDLARPQLLRLARHIHAQLSV
jgi:anti-sigma factor RsiW